MDFLVKKFVKNYEQVNDGEGTDRIRHAGQRGGYSV